jgi:hypothetical protein
VTFNLREDYAMGTHTEWTQGLMADIKSMYQLRAEENQIRVEEVKLRKVTVSEMLSNFRALAKKVKHELHKRAIEVRESLGTYGRDVRKAAEIWKNRDLTSRSSYAEGFNESANKHAKKKGKH